VKKKILFTAEAVSWSQVVRMMVLARGLDSRRYEVHFASARFDQNLFHDTKFTRWLIEPLLPEKIDAWNNSNYSSSLQIIYDKTVIAKHVAEDIYLYEAIHPDLVVSDLRWSTSISAPAFGVPCANLINAYWSLRTTRKGFPLPDHPVVRLLGVFGLESVVERYFPILMPIGLRRLAAPMNEVREKYGLPAFGDLIDAVSWGDRVLFPDDPLVTPLTHQAPHETFLGPVLWSPQMSLPPYWDELCRDRPMIYATLGSSGAVKAVSPVLEALGSMDVDVVFSTAARFAPKDPPSNVHVVDMIPGDLAARKASVVVCNGGSSTGYQALAEGTPVVSIPSNIDQHLAATAICDTGAGLFLRAATVTAAKVRAAVERVMRQESFTQAAQRVAASFARFDPHARFRAVIDDLCG
jgi:UDP:flavonoid glycosyltransferase YjiC (YdhE family)